MAGGSLAERNAAHQQRIETQHVYDTLGRWYAFIGSELILHPRDVTTTILQPPSGRPPH